MPNWCSNILYIKGSKESLKEFKKNLDLEKGLLTSFLPLPEELNVSHPVKIITEEEYASGLHDGKLTLALSNKYTRLYGADNWYDWKVKTWGTKWDVEAEMEDFEYHLVLNFQSAWSPPIAGVEKISGMFPELVFEILFEEPGGYFEGQFLISKGETLESQEGDYTGGEDWDENGNEISDHIPMEERFDLMS